MEKKSYLDRITLISGGQTGIDRAMLDFCLDRGIRCGGWCPEGRMAEDGIISLKYPVKELPKASYKTRTVANVKDSDAIVIIFFTRMEGGTLKSFEITRKENKPFLLLDMSVLDVKRASLLLRKFLEKFQPSIVNFSGPRHNEWNEGYACCYTILQELFG